MGTGQWAMSSAQGQCVMVIGEWSHTDNGVKGSGHGHGQRAAHTSRGGERPSLRRPSTCHIRAHVILGHTPY
eukprot:152170-Prymnesium_polylepis.1